MELVRKIAFILVIIGGLNWGLFVFGLDIGKYLPNVVSMIIYILVALSALVLLFLKPCKNEKGSMSQSTEGPAM